VNIKLAKCGGIREALRMIHVARAFGLKVMLGCMVETSLGIAAANHIASLVDVVDLDGHLLLADDPFNALCLEGDRVLPKDRPGLGADASSLFGEGDAT
jgi:L-alanine-DL-glutamate epimerase-like enolase superfamily enzyme